MSYVPRKVATNLIDNFRETEMSESAGYEPSFSDRMRVRKRHIGYWLNNYLAKKALSVVVWTARDSNYLHHCRREVPDWFKEDGPNRWIADGTIELLSVLSHQGHSGGSIGFALSFFRRMAMFNPHGPLTGEDSEWQELDDGIYQNVRRLSVFKDSEGAYDIDGRVFRDPEGMTYTNGDSRLPVDFPYTPADSPEIIDVDAEGVPLNAS